MATIKAFKALRYNPKLVTNMENVICPPYDIVDNEEYNKLIKKSLYNLIRLELPKESETPYKHAKKLLDSWEKQGILTYDKKNSLYVYEEEFMLKNEVKKIKGLICRVKLEEFSKRIILPHEETLSKAKEDRLNLMENTACNFSPIYSLYIDDDNKTYTDINNLTNSKPTIEVTDENKIIHRLWIIDNQNITEKICSDFKTRKLYIADGHHRYETALKYNKLHPSNSSKYVMMMLVDMQNDGLVVFPTHRLVKNINDFDPQQLIKSVKTHFDILEIEDTKSIESKLNIYYKNGKNAFAFYYGKDKAVIMVLRDNSVLDNLIPQKSKAFKSLDVTVLHSLILEKLLGINDDNMANQLNLSYTRNFNKAFQEVDSGNANCAFILNPTKVSQIKDVALAGEKMPQKSTYFFPKLISGLVINDILID